jgi:hypothetical protein
VSAKESISSACLPWFCLRFYLDWSPVGVLGVGVGTGDHPYHTDTTPHHIPYRNSNQQEQEKVPPSPPTSTSCQSVWYSMVWYGMESGSGTGLWCCCYCYCYCYCGLWTWVWKWEVQLRLLLRLRMVVGAGVVVGVTAGVAVAPPPAAAGMVYYIPVVWY